MKASDYIDALKALVAEHGDLELVDAWDHGVEPPEAMDGEFVLEVWSA